MLMNAPRCNCGLFISPANIWPGGHDCARRLAEEVREA